VSAAVLIAFGVRLILVLLFLPFSALDKILNFKGAVAQAREVAPSAGLAKLLILAGVMIEIGMSAAVLSGIADRLAAAVLAAYCVATALLWKQFWRPGDFWRDPNGKARGLFWDFWKNLALAGGFLLITFGTTAATVGEVLRAPLSSSHPYAVSGARP
jgi:putative oxidoreductase